MPLLPCGSCSSILSLSSLVSEERKAPECFTSAPIRRRRLKSTIALTIASRFVLARVNLTRSRSSNDSKLVVLGFRINGEQNPRLGHVPKQHFLYFLPLPHGQGSLRPILMARSGTGAESTSGAKSSASGTQSSSSGSA